MTNLKQKARIGYIIGLFLDGKTDKQVHTMYKQKFDECEATYYRDRKAALNQIQDSLDGFTRYARNVFLARYEELYTQALEKDDIKLAADITQKGVKLLGLEVNKVEANVDSSITVEWDES